MRILTIGNMYPPHHIGGYELSWRDFVRYARARGHSVRVLTTRRRVPGRVAKGSDEAEVYRELDWYKDDSDEPLSLPFLKCIPIERRNASILRRHLRSFRPDVVSWWPMGYMSISLIEQVRRAAIPSVAVVRDRWPLYGPKTDNWIRRFDQRPRLARIFDRLVGVPTAVSFDRAAVWLFNSDYTRRQASAAGLSADNSAVVFSGLDPAFYRDRAISDWGWRLLYVGRVEHRKGVDTAIRALAQLPREATLRVVGPTDGEEGYADNLRRLSQHLNVSGKIQWEPPVDDRALPDLYGSADALIFPVRWQEPWGRVPLEAMAGHLPVIATGTGGSKEFLAHGHNCFLFAPDDVSGLASAVHQLAGQAALRERLVSGGEQTAARFTLERYGERIESHLIAATEAEAPAQPR